MKTNFKTIDDVFSFHVTNKFDRNLVKLVLLYVNNFIKKDENHINFFGGNLIGVYPIRWTTEDKLSWVYDVLAIDEFEELSNNLYSLPSIDKAFNVSSDPVNLSLVWLTYKALNSKDLSQLEIDQITHAALDMLHYKLITSLHTHYFKFSANIAIATAVYENLDNKFQLKRAGTWQGLVNLRTNDILSHNSIHYKTIRELTPNIAVVKMLNDISSRIRSVFKIITAEFHRLHQLNERISSTSKYTHVDGTDILKDSINKYQHIKSLMHDLVPDRIAFINEELITIVINIINTAYINYVRETLFYISQNYNVKLKHVNIPELIDEILMFVFTIIRKENIELHNLSTIALKLKGVLRSSRIKNIEFITIKDNLAVIIENANPGISEVNMASTRIAVLLYIALRALLK